MNLNDVFPDGLMGEGIFYALNEYNVPWKTAISSVALDLEYYGNVSGGKTISPLLRRLLVDGVITQSALTRLANSLYSMNALRWSKLWNTYQLEYNPIENYRMTEIMSDDDTITTYGRTHRKTGTESDDRTRTDESTDGVFGFNSSSASDSETSDRTIDDDNTHTFDLTDADTGSDTQSHSYELTRSGNIGVTTSQQMIESERALWMWKYFYDIVFPDIDRVLTISVYSDDVIPIAAGGVTPTGEITITLNGEYDVTEYASAAVNVPNIYTESDEGLVVYNGELVSQVGREITANGTYDTTLNNAVMVNVPVGVNVIGGTTEPTSADGSDGDIYIKYTDYTGTELPSGYTPLDYIETGDTEGAYINPNVAVSSTAYFEIKGQWTKLQSSEKEMFGAWASADYQIFMNASNIAFSVGSSALVSIARDLNAHVYKVDATGMYIDGEFKRSANWSAVPTSRLIGIFARTVNGSWSNFSPNCRVYYCKFWDGNALVRDLVPAKRDVDNVLGMYDIVNDVFYTNSGTGSFIAGEELTGTPIDAAYLKVNGVWSILEDCEWSDIII